MIRRSRGASCAGLTSDDDPAVAALRLGSAGHGRRDRSDGRQPSPPGRAGLTSPLRRVRAAAIAVARGAGQESYRDFAVTRVGSPRMPGRLRLAQIWIDLPDTSDARPTVVQPDQLIRRAWNRSRPPTRTSPRGSKPCGCCNSAWATCDCKKVRPKSTAATSATPRRRSSAAERDATRCAALAPAFPSGDDELDRELARLLGMLSANDDGLLTSIAHKWTAASTRRGRHSLPDRGLAPRRAAQPAVHRRHGRLSAGLA